MRDSGHRISLEAQGHIFKVRVPSLRGRVGGGPRGRVCGFSYASRKRLLEKLARLDLCLARGCRSAATFLTLTYPGDEGDLPNPAQCKEHLRAFLERLRRRYPESSGVWRLQFDSGGRRDYHPHFHVILFNLPYVPKGEIQRWWGEVIGADRPFTRIESIRSWRGVMSYAASYVASASSGLDYIAYLHGDKWTGRVWGVFNRDFLPYAELIPLSIVAGRWFFDLKRSGRRAWKGVNRGRWKGFTLFRENPQRWLELALYYCG
jgi:hypothetical protein